MTPCLTTPKASHAGVTLSNTSTTVSIADLFTIPTGCPTTCVLEIDDGGWIDYSVTALRVGAVYNSEVITFTKSGYLPQRVHDMRLKCGTSAYH